MVRKAVFDHVDDAGVVILTVGDEHVELDDSDAFEQGLLAAKQIKAEARTDALPPETEGLPISQIQNLVRAGVSTDKIADKYNMEPALIRRFAQPIEQEKRSAIAQFLTVNIRQNDEVRRLGELINGTLVEAGVDTATVEWSASRNKREPWKISAFFPHNSRIYKATWSWNMRDNAVVAIDPTAKRLLGQSDAAARDLLFGDDDSTSISTDVPQSGPNPPSWMIEEDGRRQNGGSADSAADARTDGLVSQDEDDTRLFGPEPSATDTDATTTFSPLADAAAGTSSAVAAQESADGSDPRPQEHRLTDRDDDLSDSSHSSQDPTSPAEDSRTDVTEPEDGTHAGEKRNSLSKKTAARSPKKSSARYSRRNAIPSWDDIIFGD